MTEIKDLLERKWKKRFGSEFRTLETKKKKIAFPESGVDFSVVYLEHLEKYKKYPTENRSGEPECFMCKNEDEYNRSEGTAKFGHLNIWLSLKFAAPCHYLIFDPSDHREEPNEKDIIALHELAKATGLSIFGNYRSSGAGFPQHAHYQSLEIVFPIARSKEIYAFTESGIKAEKLRYPITAFRLTWEKASSIGSIAKIIPELPKPYNLMFFGDEIYLVPRIKSTPSNAKSFKFGAAEVLGHVFSRSEEIYDFFDRPTLKTSLENVCLKTGSWIARLFEEKLKELLYLRS